MKNRSGEKPDLVLLHGFRGAPIGLEKIAEELRKAGYKVFCPNVPPFAGAKLLPEYTKEGYADFIKAFAEEKGLKKPLLIGHSMGSLVACAAASKYPQLFDRRLILLSPISVRPATLIAEISPMSAYLPRTVVDHITTRYLATPKGHRDYKNTIDITDKCSRETTTKSKKDITAAAKFSADHAVGDFQLSQKILMIAGAKDRLIKPEITQKLGKKLGAKVVILPETGHLHNYEQPDLTAKEIAKFLNATNGA